MQEQGEALQKQQIHVLKTRLYKRDTGASIDSTQVVVYLGPLNLMGLMGGDNTSSSFVQRPYGTPRLAERKTIESMPWGVYFNDDYYREHAGMHTMPYQRHWETSRSTSGPFIITGTSIKGFFIVL